jgi:GDPmannose 4,6-dehydratase
MKIALVTGVTGQDGSYMADLLLEKKYKVIGLHRRSSTNNLGRVSHLLSNKDFTLEEFDLTDPSGTNQIIQHYQPTEFYNLGAQSHVGTSFKQPTTTFEIDAVGVINILEAIRHYSPQTKLYQAGTSEMFGRNYSTDSNGKKYQDENTTMLPQSPYGVAKLASYHMIQIYRVAYGLHCCCGILFNHESPRRGENFVTRKITKYLGKVIRGENVGKLELGNLDAHRDWGHAKDYVKGMWMMLQQPQPSDYVLATGETHSVKEFLLSAFELANLNYKNYVDINEDLFRPAEVDYLCGDATKAKTQLSWTPSYSFGALIQDMVYSDSQPNAKF